MSSTRMFDTPYLHRWRRAAVAVGILVTVAIATFFYSAIALAVLFGLLMIFAAHAIASGGKPRPTEPSSRAEIDRAWAEGVAACPLWVETTATSIEWASLSAAGALAVFSDTQPFPLPLDDAAFVLLPMTPVVVAVAFAMAFWERRTAQRILLSLTS